MALLPCEVRPWTSDFWAKVFRALGGFEQRVLLGFSIRSLPCNQEPSTTLHGLVVGAVGAGSMPVGQRPESGIERRGRRAAAG